jgi:adenine-specific DNA-methyltransferase
MSRVRTPESVPRYQAVSAEKASGATYTPVMLAEFVARKIVERAAFAGKKTLRVLDPAVGDGQLILSLLDAVKARTSAQIEVYGFDTDATALDTAARRIRAEHPAVVTSLVKRNFLDFALEQQPYKLSLFAAAPKERFDLIIANPPYVRTQIMGADQAQQLAQAFGLAGRVDLYQAFLLGMADVLHGDGVAGMIVSNRFMTIKGGAVLRTALSKRFSLQHIWDLGDTKLFSAAVLPVVIVAKGVSGDADPKSPSFSSIYEVRDAAELNAKDPIEALEHSGVVEVGDGRKFSVKHGTLDQTGGASAVWRIATDQGDQWLETVRRHTWKEFGGIGRVRVGVKTCADSIFIRHDWESAFADDRPELLRPLITHHSAGRFRAISPKKTRAILYPHEVLEGRRQAIDLDLHPHSKTYLEKHRATLEGRRYVIEGGRRWYEIWVPQDPSAWSPAKLVFRDISERPTFWIDLDGSVVNGDCYWLVLNKTESLDWLWLAVAVANSTFAEAFYDRCFNNKLYSGRRRFITQYVERFPLPDPTTRQSQEIVTIAKAIYDANHASMVEEMENRLDISLSRFQWYQAAQVSHLKRP